MGSDPRSSLIVTSRALYFNPIASIAVTSAPSLMTWTVPRLFTTISSGFDHSCALDAAGNAYCWGYNDAGGIADGGELGSTAGLAPEWPVQVDGSQTFSQLALGAYHSCGLTAAHALYCWGDNRGGEYGDGTRTSHNAPTLVPTSQQFTSIAAGEDFTCGLTSDGTPYCWGTNSDGALGDGTQTDRLTPTPVAGGLHFASFVMNAGHAACALTSDGHAYCWGSNSTGRLGDGTTTDHLTPQLVSGGLLFTQLMAGVDHVCGLVSGGHVYCWGDNSAGQLGDGTQTQRLVPTPVSGGVSFQSLGSGLPSFFSCGIGVDGFAYCWGDDYASELATGPEVNVTLPVCHAPTFNVYCSLSPRRIYGPRIFAQLSLNLFGVCGQTVTEGAYCWGDDTYGENGDGFYSLTNNTVALVAAPESPNVVSPRRAASNFARRTSAHASALVQSAVPDRRTRHPALAPRR
jgi:alpha-tubulin suppressor-like RCC1 family protein